MVHHMQSNISACSTTAAPRTLMLVKNFVEALTATVQRSENVTGLTLNCSYTVATYIHNDRPQRDNYSVGSAYTNPCMIASNIN